MLCAGMDFRSARSLLSHPSLHVRFQREKSSDYGGMEATWLLQDLKEPGADGIGSLEAFSRERASWVWVWVQMQQVWGAVPCS